MPTNLLLLPLLGGYWFIHNFQCTRFRARRLDGYRLLVESAFYGLVFSFIAWAVSRAIIQNLPSVAIWWRGVTPTPPIPYLGTACLSLLCGVFSPFALNAILNLTKLLTAQEAHLKAIERHGNDLLRLLHKANHEELLVSVTLDNKKVYIGPLASAPDLEPHEIFFSMVPFFSGYREASTLELVLTVSYLEVSGKHDLDLANFLIVIPIASVRSANLFDQDAYPKFTVKIDDPPAYHAATQSTPEAASPTEVSN